MKAVQMTFARRAVLVTASALSLVACAVTFPGAGGDISLASNWPNETLPDAGVSVTFDQDGTYTAQTRDVAFSNIYFKADSSVFDFSATPTRVISCYGKSYEALYLNGMNRVCTLKGGAWKAMKKGCVSVGYKANVSSGNTLTLDGAALSDFSTVYVGYSRGSDGRLVLTNGASLACTTQLEISNNAGSGNRLEVNAGSSVTAPKLYTDFGATGRSATSGRSEMLVRGSGASVTLTGDLDVGYRHDGNTVRLTDHAALSASALTFSGAGDSLSTGNRVLVDSGATATLSELIVGDKTSGNEFVLSNATLSTTTLTVGNAATASNNLFRVTGSDSSLTFAYDKFPFAAGSHNAFEVADGATITTAGSCTMSESASNNVIRLCSGATWNGKNVTFSSATDPLSWGNRLEIGAEATLDLSAKLTVNSHDNTVVISNGTLRTTSNNATAVQLASDAATNNTLRLEGATPAVRLVTSGAGMTLYRGSKLEFVLPPGGYAASHVPITATYVKMDASSSIVIDSSLLNSVAHGKLTMTLCETTGTPTFPAAVLARANAELNPKGLTLSYASKKLTLTAKGNQGVVIFLR